MKVQESILYEVLNEGSESNGLRFTSLENGEAPKQIEMCEGLTLKSMKSTIQISFSVHSGSTYILKVPFKSFHLIIHLTELQKGTKLCNLCLQSDGYYRFPTLLSADGASNIDRVDKFGGKIVNFVVVLKNDCDAGEGDADRNGNADDREIIENVYNANHEAEDGNADDGEENGNADDVEENGNADDGEVNGEEHGVEENAEENGHDGLLEAGVETWVEVFRVTTDHVQHFLGNLDKAQWHGPADVLNEVHAILAQEGELPGYDTPAIEDFHIVCYTEEHDVLNFPVLLVPWDDFVNELHSIHAIDLVGSDSGKRKRKRLCDEFEEEEEGKKKPKRLSCQLGNEYDDGDGSEIKNEDNAGDDTEKEEEDEEEDEEEEEEEEEEIENVDNAGDEVESGNADDGEVNGEEHGDEENAEDNEFADWLEAELMNMVEVYRVTPDHILHILGYLDKGQCNEPGALLDDVYEILAQEGELPGYDTPAIEDYRIVFYTEEDDLLNYPLLLPWDEFQNELFKIHAIDPVGSDSGEEEETV